MTSIRTAPGRLVGAWTRLSDKGAPMGRLHAAERESGSLEPYALCGFKISDRALKTRPFPIFDETNRKACSSCIVRSWDH